MMHVLNWQIIIHRTFILPLDISLRKCLKFVLHMRRKPSWLLWLKCPLFCHQEALEQEVKGLEERVSAIQQMLGDLKVQLYAKFGDNINLEADESWALKEDTDSWTLFLFFNAALVSDPRTVWETRRRAALGLQLLAFVYTHDASVFISIHNRTDELNKCT